MPVPPRPAISTDDLVSPAAPMSWIATRRSPLHQLEARFEQELLGERIADLHGRALALRLGVELRRREQARAVDAVAAGREPTYMTGLPTPSPRRERSGRARTTPSVNALTRMLSS